MRTAKETIEEFWRIQDDGDYTKLTDLFSDDAVVRDPLYGTFEGKAAIAAFMETMNEDMPARETYFVVSEIAGSGDVAWAQWTAKTPQGDIDGCGVYRVKDGLLTHYRDYVNAPAE